MSAQPPSRRRQVVHSRRKGKRGELEVVDILKTFGWRDAQRDSHGRRQRDGDIGNGPAATHIEVKRKRTVDVCASLDQIFRDLDPLNLPVLAHRADGFPWLATLPHADLRPLLELGGGGSYHMRVREFKRISVCRVFVDLAQQVPGARIPVLEHRPVLRHPWMSTVFFSDLLALLALRERV